MVAADLAAVIGQWHEDGAPATSDRYTALAEFLCAMPGASPAHELLRAVLAADSLILIANRALGKEDAAAVEIAVDTIKETLLQLARVVNPVQGTPWWTILDQYVGSPAGLGPEPDPLIELVERDRRLAAEFESFDEAADPERYRQLEDELNATTDAIFAAKPRSLAGALAQLKRVRYELEVNWRREDGNHEKVICSVLAFLGARA